MAPINILMKPALGWTVPFSVLFLLVNPQYSLAYSYMTLGADGELADVASHDFLNQADPIVWSQNRISLAMNLDGVDAPSSAGISKENNGWNAAVITAMEKWNTGVSGFNWERDSVIDSGDICSSSTSNDGVNQIAWSADYCGQGWNGDILALTQITYLITEIGGVTSAEVVDTHILVNSNKSWDIYNGSLAYDNRGTPVYDLQRVLLHELGHALGLTHPDENGQDIAAIMLSTESDIYNLTSDDIEGGTFLYPEKQSGASVGGISTITGGSGGGSFGIFLTINILFALFFRRVGAK